MRQIDKERVNRYRVAYPEDIRSAELILEDLERIRQEKKYINKWIENEVFNQWKNKTGKN